MGKILRKLLLPHADVLQHSAGAGTGCGIYQRLLHARVQSFLGILSQSEAVETGPSSPAALSQCHNVTHELQSHDCTPADGFLQDTVG